MKRKDENISRNDGDQDKKLSIEFAELWKYTTDIEAQELSAFISKYLNATKGRKVILDNSK